MAFIRMRSPKRAPPVLRLEGSTDTTATRGPTLGSDGSPVWVTNLRMTSSTSDDLPAPPVPVMPRTGAFWPRCFAPSALRVWMSSSKSWGSFSAIEMPRAKAGSAPRRICSAKAFKSFAFSLTMAKSDCCNKSLIIPCKPMARPSSGE